MYSSVHVLVLLVNVCLYTSWYAQITNTLWHRCTGKILAGSILG